MYNNDIPTYHTVAPYVKPAIGTTWKTNLIVTQAGLPNKVVTRVTHHHVYFTWENEPIPLEYKESRYYWTRYMTQVPTEV